MPRGRRTRGRHPSPQPYRRARGESGSRPQVPAPSPPRVLPQMPPPVRPRVPPRLPPSRHASRYPLVPTAPLRDPARLAQSVERGSDRREVEARAQRHLVERGRLPPHGLENRGLRRVGGGPQLGATPPAGGTQN